MKNFIPAISLVIAFVTVSGCASLPPGKSSETILPVPGFHKDWLADGPVAQYTPENLFDYIDGEADIYYPYGFQKAEAVKYLNKADAEYGLFADVYEMGSPLDAFGIYSNYRSPDMEFLRIGAEGFFSGEQLMFYQDRFFVRLTASRADSANRDNLVACATKISANLPTSPSILMEPGLVGGGGIVMRSEMYIAQSVLGYAFFPRGLTADADLAPETRIRPFVVLCKTQEEADAVFPQYTALLKKYNAACEIVSTSLGERLITQDPLMKGVVLERRGLIFYGVARLTKPDDGFDYLAKMIANSPTL